MSFKICFFVCSKSLKIKYYDSFWWKNVFHRMNSRDVLGRSVRFSHSSFRLGLLWFSLHRFIYIFYWNTYTFLGHPEPNRTEKWTFLDCLNRTDTEITILSHPFKNRIMSFLSLILLSQTKTPVNCKNVCWVKNSAALAKALGTVKLWHWPKIEISTLINLNW